MAALAGRHGLVKWATKQVFRIDHWDLSVDVDQLDVTAFSTDGVQWRAFAPGLSQWSGSISGFQDVIGDSSGQKAMQTAILTPATGTIKLYLSETGGENFYGSVYLRNLNVNVDVADSEKTVFGFQGNGTLAYSTTG